MDRLAIKLDNLDKNKKLEKITKALLTATNRELASIVRTVIDDNDKDKILIINAAINLGLDPNYILMNCYHLLDYAIMKNDIPVAITIVERGANIDRKKYSDCSHLHLCAQDGNHVMLNYFIRKGLNINETDKKKNTPIFVACCLCNKNCVKILVENNADIEMKNSSSLTPFEIVMHKMYYHLHDSDSNKERRKRDFTNTKLDRKVFIADMVTIFELLITIKKKITTKELWKIQHICLTGPARNIQLDIMKIIMKKFPETINQSFDKYNNTLLHQTILLHNQPFIDYFMTEIPYIDYSNKIKMA